MQSYFCLKYVLANILTQFGNSIHFVAITWLIYQLTGSVTMIGIILGACFIPRIIVSYTYTKVMISISHKSLLIFSDLIRFFIILILPIQYYSGVDTSLLLVVGIEFLVAGLGSVFSISAISLLKSHAPADALLSINRYREVGVQLAIIMGAVAAGFIIVSYSIYIAFIINALTFLLSAGLLALIHSKPNNANASKKKVLSKPQQLTPKLYRQLNKTLLALLIIMIPAIVFDTVMAEVASVQLHGDSMTYAVLEGCYAVGAFMTILIGDQLFQCQHSHRRLIPMMLLLALLCSAIAVLNAIAIAIIVSVALGLIGILLKVHLLTEAQKMTPTDSISCAQGYMQFIQNIGAGSIFIILGACANKVAIGVLCCSAGIILLMLILWYYHIAKHHSKFRRHNIPRHEK